MKPLLVFPDPVPPELAQTLDIGGWAWKAAVDVDAARADEPADGWVGAIVMAASDLEPALRFCRSVHNGDVNVGSLLLLINGGHLQSLDPSSGSVRRLLSAPVSSPGAGDPPQASLSTGRQASEVELIEYGPLAMNLETYQAVIDAKPLDLTYMEYELLKFLAAHPAKSSPAKLFSTGSGVTTITEAHAPWMCMCGVCAQSSARSTPT